MAKIFKKISKKSYEEGRYAIITVSEDEGCAFALFDKGKTLLEDQGRQRKFVYRRTKSKNSVVRTGVHFLKKQGGNRISRKRKDNKLNN